MNDITDILADVVNEISKDVTITIFDGDKGTEVVNPPINFIFGSALYVKEELDIYSKTSDTSVSKFPLIALFTPVVEKRDSNDYFSTADVSLIIACSTKQDFSNEQRKTYSFVNVLRPIYRKMLEKLKENKRLDFGYDETVKHTYSENYSYGRYGAYADNGEAVSEPIDAIDIRSLSLKIKNPIICNRL